MLVDAFSSVKAEGGGDRIIAVESIEAVVPLPKPLQVGAAIVRSRSYVLTRVRTASGLEGIGYAFGRGLPVAEIVNRALAPILIGLDPRYPKGLCGRQQRTGRDRVGELLPRGGHDDAVRRL